MKTSLVPPRFGACLGALALAFGLVSGCSSDPETGVTPGDGEGGSAGIGGGGFGNGPTGGGGSGSGGSIEPPTCTPTVAIEPNSRALVITDPEILAKFSLERVLQQMIEKTEPSASTTPLELLQRLFDTEN